MSQYYLIVNADKREYLDPHVLGEDVRLTEFGLGGCGTMAALAVLLADGNGRGAGDLDSADPIIGSWRGSRVVVAGDYADYGEWPGVRADETLYHGASKHFKDISRKVIHVLCVLEEFRIAYVKRGWWWCREWRRIISRTYKRWPEDVKKARAELTRDCS